MYTTASDNTIEKTETAPALPAHEMRRKTRELIMQHFAMANHSEGKPYVLEASIGIANGKCSDKSSLEALLEQADKAMYEEKVLYKQRHKDA